MNRAASVRGSDVPGLDPRHVAWCYGWQVVRSERTVVTRALSGVCAAILLLGCGAEPSSDAAADSTVTSTADTVPDSVVGSATTVAASVDDWTSPVVGGGTFSFAEARAKGPFGFWFWAPG